MIKQWLYFGCGTNNDGHYLWPASIGYPMQHRLSHFDGALAPQPEGELYVAAVTRLGGWNATAISWWDQSADKRPGSNSIIFAPSLTIEPVEILAEATKRFPWVFERLPSGIRIPAQP